MTDGRCVRPLKLLGRIEMKNERSLTYDCIIVGAGPEGIFTAMEYLKPCPGKKILILRKGKRIEERSCPMRETGWCGNCDPCNITVGFSGAGAFSDGKLMLSPEIGGKLDQYLPEDQHRE